MRFVQKGCFILAGLLVVGGWASLEPLQASEISSEESLLLAMHYGRPHGGRHERHQHHHGMGRGGQGICPQARATAEAPDKIAQQKNPFEVNSENFIKGNRYFNGRRSPTRARFATDPSVTVWV